MEVKHPLKQQRQKHHPTPLGIENQPAATTTNKQTTQTLFNN